ncbi:MAG: M20/M25/M40 family metallo-hydrolase [Candidatus Eisenbacteria bacterium]
MPRIANARPVRAQRDGARARDAQPERGAERASPKTAPREPMRSGRLRRGILVACLAFAATAAPSRAGASPSRAADGAARADADRIEQDLRFLAADELMGRGLGSAGLHRALQMVAGRFAELGLAPAFPDRSTPADPRGGYFQPFIAEGRPVSANVIGILPGHAARSPRALLIGAHVDHLGTAPTARDAGSAATDSIFNGADDNASGVAALLEIARLLCASVPQAEDRTVIFVVFSGEESGLLGSRHYTEAPCLPNAELIAMINLDSVGRMRERQVIVFGSGTAREFPDVLEGLNQSHAFDLALRAGEGGASDQASFYAAGVPALHFFTGPHADYSRVTDEAEAIHYAGLAELTDYVAELAQYLRYRRNPLTYVSLKTHETERVARMAREGERRVSLGFMPDFARESGGVRVGSVTPGGAAAAAGLLPGDTITALDGEPLDTLVDYTALLREHEPGDRVILTVLREGRMLQIAASVQERR